MKNMIMWLRLMVAVIGVACVASPAITWAADDDDDKEHRDRIEAKSQGGGYGAPAMSCGPERRCPIPPRYRCCFLTGLLVWVALIHTLLASWVFTDIRKRGDGHGIFVVLALLAGIPGTILYALVRIGDAKKT